jgi:hypothetical protein
MQMEAFLWMFLPVFVAGGSALLSFYIMQAKMEIALSKERELLAEARATINSQRITLEERIKATEEASKRQALDDFMQDIRIEERSYVRESKSMWNSKKSMVMQERLFFRNIPLSNWIEQELVVEEGKDLNQIPRESAFTKSVPAAQFGGGFGNALGAGIFGQGNPQNGQNGSDGKRGIGSAPMTPSIPPVQILEALLQPSDKPVAMSKFLNDLPPVTEVQASPKGMVEEAAETYSSTTEDLQVLSARMSENTSLPQASSPVGALTLSVSPATGPIVSPGPANPPSNPSTNSSANSSANFSQDAPVIAAVAVPFGGQ